MFTVTAQFTQVGCSETPCDISANIEGGCDIVDDASAHGEARERTGEGLEAQRTLVVQLMTVQFSVVHTHATVDMQPFVEVLTEGGEQSDIEEVISRDEVLYTTVARLLPHTVDTDIPFPSAPLGGDIPQVVVDGMQLEIESALIRFLIFLTTVLLVAKERLQLSVTQTAL